MIVLASIPTSSSVIPAKAGTQVWARSHIPTFSHCHARVGGYPVHNVRRRSILFTVIPAKAGTQCHMQMQDSSWVPAFAGMTNLGRV
jgi:hypothetical protein